jgi:hypothetical protein
VKSHSVTSIELNRGCTDILFLLLWVSSLETLSCLVIFHQFGGVTVYAARSPYLTLIDCKGLSFQRVRLERRSVCTDA